MDAGVALLRDELHELMKVVRVVKQRQHQQGVVAPGMIGVLATIDKLAGRCHLKELAATCALDQSTTSRVVSAFVQAGLVRRVADPSDGRASFLELTDHGREALRESAEHYASLLADALRDWSRADIEQLGALLRRFAQSLLTEANR